MKKTCTLCVLTLAMIAAEAGLINCQNAKKDPGMTITENSEDNSSGDRLSALSMSIVFDNYRYDSGLDTSWGFACFIRGTEKTILFDTGGDGSILMSNMKKMGIRPSEVELVVLSHYHGDHTDGLMSFLDENPDVTVFAPQSFPGTFKNEITGRGARVVEVREPVQICENVLSTGEMGTSIIEQSLVIRTEKGSIVITGCAHPGIVGIVRKAKDLTGHPICFVTGGFHLGGASRGRLEEIVRSFNELGVAYTAPTHCSGDAARAIFEEDYQDHYLSVGVGRIVSLDEFK